MLRKLNHRKHDDNDDDDDIDDFKLPNTRETYAKRYGLKDDEQADADKGSNLKASLRGEPITDAEGMHRAYRQGDAYTRGDTMYVAGSHRAKDWYDDVTKIPAWGDLRDSDRYRSAEKAMEANPNVKRVVGHSLGGSVALEMQKNNPKLETRTYGAPVFNPLGREKNVDRYRNILDPVSILDQSAQKTYLYNPFGASSLSHQYDNIASNYESSGNESAYGWQNPDNTVSLTQ